MVLYIAILNSIFPFLVTSVAGFFTAFSILSQQKKDKEKMSFAVSWFFIGSVYFLATVRITAYALGYVWIDKSTFYLLEVFTGLTAIPFTYHIASKLTKDKDLIRMITLVTGMCALLFIFFVFSEGVVGPKEYISGSDYTPSKKASLSFAIPSAAMFLMLVIHLIKNFRYLFAGQEPHKKASVKATISFILFIVSAGIDEVGINAGWFLFGIRILTMTAALIATMSYTQE